MEPIIPGMSRAEGIDKARKANSQIPRILDRLETPRRDANKLLAANCLKLIALAKAEKQAFASPAFDPMIESIVRLACEMVCCAADQTNEKERNAR